MFQCGPEPQFILAHGRLSDGRYLALFRKPGDLAELVITVDNLRPEIWKRLTLNYEQVMLMEFQRQYREEEMKIAKRSKMANHNLPPQVTCVSCLSPDLDQRTAECRNCRRRVCLSCGCTDDNACVSLKPPTRCSWARRGLCSFCAATAWVL